MKKSLRLYYQATLSTGGSDAAAESGTFTHNNSIRLRAGHKSSANRIYPLHYLGNEEEFEPVSAPDSPDIFCTAGDNPGEIDLQWDPVYDAQNYLIEISVEKPSNWYQIASTKSSKITLQGLQSGVLY